MFDGCHYADGGFQRFVAALAPDLGHGQQNAANTGAAIPIIAGNVSAAKVRAAVGSEKRRERPATLPGDRRDRGLVARVHVGTLVAIHLHRNEILIDHLGNFGIFVRFAIHDMAPVAPHRTNVEQNGLVLSPGASKRSLAPGLPLDRLMASGA